MSDMRIIEETQLDFDDLLISPKRSTLNSRSEVELSRTFEWTDLNGNRQSLTCVPIIVANMATIGTPKIAKIVSKHGFLCALEKHYPLEVLDELFTDLENIASVEGLPKDFYSQKVMPSIGVKENTDIIKKLNEKHSLKCVCIDVPNGYIPKFIDRINEIAKICPQAMLICGNVVTGDICQDIILHGHGITTKIGIGQGCFLGNMCVLTSNGLKKIQDIEIGEKVLTHTGKFETVINKFMFNTHKKIIDINGIKCTPNHKFYVAKIEDIDKITEENYKDYCIWVEAKDLDMSKYKLLKIKT